MLILVLFLFLDLGFTAGSRGVSKGAATSRGQVVGLSFRCSGAWYDGVGRQVFKKLLGMHEPAACTRDTNTPRAVVEPG